MTFTASACRTVRGKLSMTIPFAAPGDVTCSLTRLKMSLSDTSSPRSMDRFASRPSGVSAWTAWRRRSPVVILGTPIR
jgi:hypothetical protein